LLSDLIVPLVRSDSLQFDNVDRAQSLGVEGSAGWSSKNGWVELEANATYQDYRNRSRRGEYAAHAGDRIIYRPYLFANGLATLFARSLMERPDELAFSYRASYVHEFFLGWESVNTGGGRLRVPYQLVHALSATLLLVRGKRTISSSIEVHNLTDRRVYDFFGAQLPGRAFAAKLTLGV
jgi:vitamin B12 transporter